MAIRLPQNNRQWKGQFLGNYSGNLWQTFNIDLERFKGRIALADKMLRFSSGLGVISKFIRTNANQTDQWWGLVDATDIVKNGSSTINAGTWATDNSTATFNDPRDAVVHEIASTYDNLLVTRATDIALLNNGTTWDDDWWTVTKGKAALTSLAYHPIARLQRLVAVGDKVSGIPVLHTIDQNLAIVTSRLPLPPGYTVRNIYTSSNRFWIGLANDKTNNARIIEWDGFFQTYNAEYDLVGTTPLCGFIVGNIPYFITEFGYIYRLGPSGFDKVQDFGLYENGLIFNTGQTDIGNYSAYVDGSIVYIVVRPPVVSTVSATVMPNGTRRLRSGIYIFDTTNFNLYHHMGVGEHASAGTDVNYGAHIVSVGAITKLSSANSIIASASVYIGGATWQASEQSGIYEQTRNDAQTSNAGRNRGYFITPFIPLAEVDAYWDALWVKFKRFVNSNNRIVVKWRTVDPLFNSSAQDQAGNALKIMNAPATWVNTTSFTCKVPTGVAVGDEVEILSGDNGGCNFNISALSGTPDNTTSLTVTIDEAAPTSSTDTFLCRFDNFRTETAISSVTVGHQKIPFTVSTTANSGKTQGEFIQFKVELRGFDVHLDELIPVFRPNTKSEQA